MDVEVIKVFVDVMRRGSFAAVARHRDVDPSSISRAIATLEREIGFRLFQRTTRRLAPTEAGALYFERVQPLVEEMERARLQAMDVVTGPVGLLRVTASVSFGQKCLVPLLPALRTAYPALSIDLILTDAVVDLIAERVDIAIRLGPRTDSGLIGTRLMRTRYRVCASPGYLEAQGSVADPPALSERDCLRFPLSGYRSCWRFRDREGDLLDVPVKGSVMISNALALHRAARDGLGPALLANWIVDEDIARGALVDLFPDHEVTATDFDTAVWILYPSRSYVPLKVRAFIDFLKARMGNV